MTLRTTTTSITFTKPFTLAESNETYPPGVYEVETDEELLEGLSFHAYRRVRTVMRLPVSPGRRGVSRSLMIDPEELEAALRQEAQPDAPPGAAPAAATSTLTAVTAIAEVDRRAVDRAEDEGMIAHPQ